MRRFGRQPGGPRPVQLFDYGPLRFNVNRAETLASNRKKYRPETRPPSAGWIGPFIEIDDAHVERCDPARPILFATLALPGHPRELLIDGNHRVAHALRHGKTVRVIVLDLEDTLKVVSGPEDLLRRMREASREGASPDATGQAAGRPPEGRS